MPLSATLMCYTRQGLRLYCFTLRISHHAVISSSAPYVPTMTPFFKTGTGKREINLLLVTQPGYRNHGNPSQPATLHTNDCDRSAYALEELVPVCWWVVIQM